MFESLHTLEFIRQNQNVKFTKLFYNKVIFSIIYHEKNGFNAEGLLFLFEKDMMQEYVFYKKSALEIENIVLDKFPNNTTILEYRDKCQKQWFDFSI